MVIKKGRVEEGKLKKQVNVIVEKKKNQWTTVLEHWEQTELEQLGTVSKVKKYSEKYYYPVEEIASKEPVEVFRARVLSYVVAKKKRERGRK